MDLLGLDSLQRLSLPFPREAWPSPRDVENRIPIPSRAGGLDKTSQRFNLHDQSSSVWISFCLADTRAYFIFPTLSARVTYVYTIMDPDIHHLSSIYRSIHIEYSGKSSSTLHLVCPMPTLAMAVAINLASLGSLQIFSPAKFEVWTRNNILIWFVCFTNCPLLSKGIVYMAADQKSMTRGIL